MNVQSNSIEVMFRSEIIGELIDGTLAEGWEFRRENASTQGILAYDFGYINKDQIEVAILDWVSSNMSFFKRMKKHMCEMELDFGVFNDFDKPMISFRVSPKVISLLSELNISFVVSIYMCCD